MFTGIIFRERTFGLSVQFQFLPMIETLLTPGTIILVGLIHYRHETKSWQPQGSVFLVMIGEGNRPSLFSQQKVQNMRNANLVTLRQNFLKMKIAGKILRADHD
jgi:hypothetical protein